MLYVSALEEVEASSIFFSKFLRHHMTKKLNLFFLFVFECRRSSAASRAKITLFIKQIYTNLLKASSAVLHPAFSVFTTLAIQCRLLFEYASSRSTSSLQYWLTPAVGAFFGVVDVVDSENVDAQYLRAVKGVPTVEGAQEQRIVSGLRPNNAEGLHPLLVPGMRQNMFLDFLEVGPKS